MQILQTDGRDSPAWAQFRTEEAAAYRAYRLNQQASMSSDLPGVDGQVTHAVDAGQAQEAQQDYPDAMQNYLAADALTPEVLQAATTLPEANRQLLIRGLVQAQSSIGRFYLNGQGVDQSYEQAATYDRKALSTLANSPYADYGVAWASNAYNDLGYMYAKGYGVPRDEEQATTFFEASRSGQPFIALLDMHRLPDTQAELTPEYFDQVQQELEAERQKAKDAQALREMLAWLTLFGGNKLGQNAPVTSYQHRPSTLSCHVYGHYGADFVAGMAGCAPWQMPLRSFDDSDE